MSSTHVYNRWPFFSVTWAKQRHGCCRRARASDWCWEKNSVDRHCTEQIWIMCQSGIMEYDSSHSPTDPSLIWGCHPFQIWHDHFSVLNAFVIEDLILRHKCSTRYNLYLFSTDISSFRDKAMDLVLSEWLVTTNSVRDNALLIQLVCVGGWKTSEVSSFSFVFGAAQVCHVLRVVELREQLDVEEEDGDRQEEEEEVVSGERSRKVHHVDDHGWRWNALRTWAMEWSVRQTRRSSFLVMLYFWHTCSHSFSRSYCFHFAISHEVFAVFGGIVFTPPSVTVDCRELSPNLKLYCSKLILRIIPRIPGLMWCVWSSSANSFILRHLFSATSVEHVSELLVSDETVVDTQEVPLFCFSLWAKCHMTNCHMASFPVTVPVGSSFLYVVVMK